MRVLTKRFLSLAGAGLTGVLLAALAVPPAGAAPSSGASGTVKIDGVEFDSLPNNEPHVGCSFQVDFYGYPAGDLFADVTFSAQAPTTVAGGSQILLTSRVFVGEDDSSGAATEAGLDAANTFTLNYNGIIAHPIQGYHVSLTVSTPSVNGTSVKQKTLWTSGCDDSEEPPPLPY